TGDWRLFFINRDSLKKVTPEDVQRVATSYLKTANRTVATFIPTEKPDRAEVPAAPDVAALVKDYKGGAEAAAGEAFDPPPPHIDSRTRTVGTGGGLKLSLLSKKTRGNTVVANITPRFGAETGLMNSPPGAD